MKKLLFCFILLISICFNANAIFFETADEAYAYAGLAGTNGVVGQSFVTNEIGKHYGVQELKSSIGNSVNLKLTYKQYLDQHPRVAGLGQGQFVPPVFDSYNGDATLQADDFEFPNLQQAERWCNLRGALLPIKIYKAQRYDQFIRPMVSKTDPNHYTLIGLWTQRNRDSYAHPNGSPNMWRVSTLYESPDNWAVNMGTNYAISYKPP